jgi:hypothetical protein
MSGHRQPITGVKMKTRLSHERGRISLIIDHGDRTKEKAVLAQMSHMEGTGCWSITDIRLSRQCTAHKYSCSEIAEDFHAHIIPESVEEAAFIKSRLREYHELENGTIVWCTFRNIVRGESSVKGYTPPTSTGFHPPVYHSRADGLAYLKALQVFWEGHEGPTEDAKVENPDNQPRESILMMEMWAHQRREKERDELESAPGL